MQAKYEYAAQFAFICFIMPLQMGASFEIETHICTLLPSRFYFFLRVLSKELMYEIRRQRHVL